MFNLQGSEIIIVLLLALVVLGPEKLPDAMRKLGQAYAELKKMSAGFQSEFRSAVDEPLRELRDTANVLRDSADFTKLQEGERPEKPKSGEMAALAPTDPDTVPSDDVPTFETGPDDATAGPELAAESQPAPFADTSLAEDPSTPEAAPTGPRALPPTPPPFTGMSSTNLRQPGQAASHDLSGESADASIDETGHEPSHDSDDPDRTGETHAAAGVTPPDDEADTSR